MPSRRDEGTESYCSNAKEAALADQWVQFVEHEIGVPALNIGRLIFSLTEPFNREVRKNLFGRTF